MDIIQLAELYAEDCNDECDNCPLGKAIDKKMDDYPFELPQLTICQCFDLININYDD